MPETRWPSPMLPLAHYGVIGDRRTAALSAADGALVWCCLPHYAGDPVFGAILDAGRGGLWRQGPAGREIGRQQYAPDTATLITSWRLPGGELELAEAMGLPWDDRSAADGREDARVILRRLRCTAGRADIALAYDPRPDYAPPLPLHIEGERATTIVAGRPLTLWSSLPLAASETGAAAVAELRAGDELWCVLSWGEAEPRAWTPARAAAELAAAEAYWRGWLDALPHLPAEARDHRCHAIFLKLLTYAPTGSPVAAPTSSLPERMGGDRNWDYRYSWVRDASLGVSVLSRIGDLATGRRYMDCLASYGSSTSSPLQVVYGVDGALDLPEAQRWDLTGYRDSRPVRTGNRACGQRQLDSLGFFIDSALTYLEAGGEWTAGHWRMVQRSAEYTVAHWRLPDSGPWEHMEERQYVASKVMSWVALDRACRIAEQIGQSPPVAAWRAEAEAIHADVLTHGWSAQRGAFTECYECDTLDAAALLIPLTGFLPVDDPRVLATIARIEEELTVDGFVYRSRNAIDGPPDKREGAFLPCSFWLVMVLTMVGRVGDAEAIMDSVADAVGEVGILSEQIDPADRSLLGNLPLVFSHAECLRACLLLDQHGRRDGRTGSAAAARIALPHDKESPHD